MNAYEIPTPASAELLSQLSCGVVRVGIYPGHDAHPGCAACVIENADGLKVRVFPSQHSLEAKFEVFPLQFSDDLPRADDILWKPLTLNAPVTATLLFTEEWLDPDAICGPSYGQFPVLQCQGPVGSAPPSASAVCRYTGGVEIIGEGDQGIFMASGSFPLTLHVDNLANDEKIVRRNYRGAA